MSTDDQFERYLRERAAQIELPSPVFGGVTRRARQRRRRRGAFTVGAAASALILGTVTFTGGSGGGDEVASQAAEPVDPTLEWTTVEVASGTGWGSPSVLTESGTIYRLSTAPGEQGLRGGPEAHRLYQSDDGTDWSEVSLPGGLWANGLAVRGDQVYAVGTSPTGGDLTTLEVARSGADGWDVEQLPLDLEALSGSLPASSMMVQSAQVAVTADTEVVAVDVVARPDVALAGILPDGADPHAVMITPEGVEVHDHSACEELQRHGGEGETETALENLDGDDGTDPAAEGCEPDVSVQGWTDLGVDDASVDALLGSTRIFAARGDEPFVEVARLDGGAKASGMVAADDGVWLARHRWDMDPDQKSVELLRSPDGRTWDPAGVVSTGGELRGFGVLDGSAVAALESTFHAEDVFEVDLRLERFGATGAEAMAGALSEDLTGLYVADVAFGPLGVAVVYGGSERMVAYSPNGNDWSTHDLPDPPAETRESANGVIVTADAVKVRLNAYDEDAIPGAEPRSQRLLVGTPQG